MKSLSNKINDVLKNSTHLMWLNDYKIYGYRSYVYQDKNILHELYEDYNLCMNDDMIRDEALEYIIDFNKNVGKAISCFYEIKSKYELSLLYSIDDIINNSIAMNAIADNEAAMNAIINNSTAINAIVNSETAMNAIINNSTAINIVVSNSTAMDTIINSETAMNIIINSEITMNKITTNGLALKNIARSTADWNTKKLFIMKLNDINKYIVNVYNTLTNTSYFTKKTSNNSSSVSSFNYYCTTSYAENGFIVCALGCYTNGGNGDGVRLKINEDIIKEITYPNAPYYPTSVRANNVNAIVIPTTTFESIGNGYGAIDVYIAN